VTITWKSSKAVSSKAVNDKAVSGKAVNGKVVRRRRPDVGNFLFWQHRNNLRQIFGLRDARALFPKLFTLKLLLLLHLSVFTTIAVIDRALNHLPSLRASAVTLH
jgi:hypothetical protein